MLVLVLYQRGNVIAGQAKLISEGGEDSDSHFPKAVRLTHAVTPPEAAPEILAPGRDPSKKESRPAPLWSIDPSIKYHLDAEFVSATGWPETGTAS